MKKELEILKQENEKLLEEIENLKDKLLVAEEWMKREVKWQIRVISEKQLNIINNESSVQSEEEISEKITNYFGDLIMINVPVSVIENLVSAEINYQNLLKNPWLDWLSVVSSYQKALDTLVESYISKWYRKFCKKVWQVNIKNNDTLEKNLHSAVNLNYIIWLWKLYHTIKLLKEKDYKDLLPYVKAFSVYLDKYDFIKEILLSDNFFAPLSVLVNSEIFWKKRHTWKVNFYQVQKARKLIIWNLENWNKSSLIYKLVEMWGI